MPESLSNMIYGQCHGGSSVVYSLASHQITKKKKNLALPSISSSIFPFDVMVQVYIINFVVVQF